MTKNDSTVKKCPAGKKDVLCSEEYCLEQWTTDKYEKCKKELEQSGSKTN